MGICEECGFDWDTPAHELAEQISQIGPRYRQQLEELCGQVGDSGLGVRPSDGLWSPLEYTAHMRDVAGFYLDRIERVITHDRPHLSAVGFAGLAESRRYNNEHVDEVLDALERTARAASARLETLTPVQWARVGIGSEGDERNVLVLARRLTHESHHHLLDLTAGHAEAL